MRRAFVSPNASYAYVACVKRTWYDSCVSSTDRDVLDIGGRIRKAREHAGLTQVQLAEQLGQAERTVQAWEGNTRTPRPGALLHLAETLGRPVSWFYEEERAA